MLLIAERLTPVTFLISSAGIHFALLSTIIFLTSTGTIFITSASYYITFFQLCLYWNCCNLFEVFEEKLSSIIDKITLLSGTCFSHSAERTVSGNSGYDS